MSLGGDGSERGLTGADLRRAYQNCPFCALLADGSRPFTHEWPDAVAFEPLGPVVPGHLLVIPRAHVFDASVNPYVTAATMQCAAVVARERWPCNIITSCGAGATQSIFHMHVHIVPRKHGDGLQLPWTALYAASAPADPQVPQ